MNKRINELVELLHTQWQKEPQLNLMQFINKLSKEMEFKGDLINLTDDMLIYHLKVHNLEKTQAIPGLKKDYEDDFKTALLKARGVIKE